jgi:serine/threonine protein kinase
VALAPGTRLGPYEVVAQIGPGGMGEVYRARDTKLNREVALKILPDAFTLDGDRIARFHREAQVLASLNHRNIAAIYGFEDGGRTHALVRELVEGPTLADRIAKGPIPLDDALPNSRTSMLVQLQSAYSGRTRRTNSSRRRLGSFRAQSVTSSCESMRSAFVRKRRRKKSDVSMRRTL